MTNDYDQEVDTDITYTFTIHESLRTDYSMTTQILMWLHDNLDGLHDDLENPLFGKVNYGFSDSTLKTFGKRPVCDVYVNRVEYDSTFERQTPIKVHTFVIFYLKGANNPTYLKATELHDLIMQEFIINDDFKLLDNVVSDTVIDDSNVSIRNIRGGYGVMGTFELTHTLY